MTEKLSGKLDDVRMAGAIVTKGGLAAINGILGAVIIALAVMVIFQQVRFTDRWTTSDQRAFEVTQDRALEARLAFERQQVTSQLETVGRLVGELKIEVRGVAIGQAKMGSHQEEIIKRLDRMENNGNH